VTFEQVSAQGLPIIGQGEVPAPALKGTVTERAANQVANIVAHDGPHRRHHDHPDDREMSCGASVDARGDQHRLGGQGQAHGFKAGYDADQP